jgi:hypothetical protein
VVLIHVKATFLILGEWGSDFLLKSTRGLLLLFKACPESKVFPFAIFVSTICNKTQTEKPTKALFAFFICPKSKLALSRLIYEVHGYYQQKTE